MPKSLLQLEEAETQVSVHSSHHTPPKFSLLGRFLFLLAFFPLAFFPEEQPANVAEKEKTMRMGLGGLVLAMVRFAHMSD